MSAPCETCGGTQIARYEDAPTPGTIGGEGTGVIVCSACSVVISIEEYEGLCKLRDQIVKHSLDFPEGIAALAASPKRAETERLRDLLRSSVSRFRLFRDAGVSMPDGWSSDQDELIEEIEAGLEAKP